MIQPFLGPVSCRNCGFPVFHLRPDRHLIHTIPHSYTLFKAWLSDWESLQYPAINQLRALIAVPCCAPLRVRHSSKARHSDVALLEGSPKASSIKEVAPMVEDKYPSNQVPKMWKAPKWQLWFWGNDDQQEWHVRAPFFLQENHGKSIQSRATQIVGADLINNVAVSNSGFLFLGAVKWRTSSKDVQGMSGAPLLWDFWELSPASHRHSGSQRPFCVSCYGW